MTHADAPRSACSEHVRARTVSAWATLALIPWTMHGIACHPLTRGSSMPLSYDDTNRARESVLGSLGEEKIDRGELDQVYRRREAFRLAPERVPTPAGVCISAFHVLE